MQQHSPRRISPIRPVVVALALALALAALAALAAGCKVDHCESNADCLQGEACNLATNECYATDASVTDAGDASPTDPDAGDAGPADAGDAETPCSGPEDCNDSTEPICDTTSSTCRECTADVDCILQYPPDNTACNTGTGECVGCVTTADHCYGAEPICDNQLCRACIDSSDCQTNVSATTPVCIDAGPDLGACVQCTDSLSHCNTDLANAYCDLTTNECRPCTIHSECDHLGGVCDNGTCLETTDVIYVDNGVACSDGGNCNAGSPCCTIQGAIGKVTGPRSTILVANGTYEEIRLDNNETAWIIGRGNNVTIQASSSVNEAVYLTGTASLTLDNITSISAVLVTSVGVYCDGDFSNHPTLTLRRSTVTLNAAGGIVLANCNYVVVNNFIVGNGGAGSNVGGVRITDPQTTTVFWHNTVSSNLIGTANSAGIQCNATVDIHSSIITGNTNFQLDGDCVPNYSLISDTSGDASGMNNTIGTPTFVGAPNYHLQPGSLGIDLADPATTILYDYDLDPRSQGAAPDCGADEAE